MGNSYIIIPPSRKYELRRFIMKPRNKLLTVVCVLVFLTGCKTVTEPVVPPHVEGLINESSFVFIGTVKKRNATTMPEISATDNMIVVKVDKVLEAAKTLGDYTSRDITVLLRQPEKARVGQQMIFFTNGWLYGRSIAVKEVGILPVEDMARAQKQVAEGIRLVAEKDLQRRIANAELVVVGKVRSVDKPQISVAQRESEHNPLWRQAVITVQSIEKGRFSKKTVVIWFPSSQDVMWYKSPKFSVNQERIWILHKYQTEALPIEAKEAYTALTQDDLHPIPELGRIRHLIQQIR
jgi:hypothetical protein